MKNSNKITVTVDGIDVLVEQGSSVLQACEVVGIEIPRFCFHERLLVAGNCRMCLVEIEKSPKPQASCAIPVMSGMKIFTDTPLVKKAREGVLEFLLLNHPLDCPICDQGGECDLQDQAMIFGSDRSRFFEPRRGVEDKNLGPLVKTIMTRCIHCTRCVRFATEVAGVEVLGTTARGIDTEIGTYVEKMFDSELSGNIIDLCPVGALTSKPYAFTSRPWELRLTESIDVMDSVGSNIRVDTRGTEIMRITPRLNEEINEEWISDKTRFSYDGLKRQRLTKPMIRDDNGNFVSVEWLEAFNHIKKNVNESSLESDQVAGIVGGLVDVETIFTLKKFISHSDSSTVISEFGGGKDLEQDFLNNHTFNSSIQGIENSDLILLVGTNPRKEAAIINARIRKRSLQGNFKIAYVGPNLDKSTQFGLNYPINHLGKTAETISQIASGKHKFSSELAQASNPIIIIGSNVLARDDSSTLISMLSQIDANLRLVKGRTQSVLSIIQPNASQYGAVQLGLDSFNPAFEETPLKFVYCVGVEDLSNLNLDQDNFIIYQGHHGNEDVALYADVILPGAAYTEKDALFFNTEGRPQSTKRALTTPGHSREDWRIINALSEYLYGTSQYTSRSHLLNAMADKIPAIKSLGEIPAAPSLYKEVVTEGTNVFIGDEYLYSSVPNFYFTCSITKASSTMAKCVELFTQGSKGALNPANIGK
jgi:NADH dehydrogenase (ubiquinone) Fe-S protein 1